MNQSGKNDYNRIWKVRMLLDELSDTYSNFYSPSVHVAMDEVTGLFKGKVIFKQYIPRKHKCFCT